MDQQAILADYKNLRKKGIGLSRAKRIAQP
jgi:hypothetical protein